MQREHVAKTNECHREYRRKPEYQKVTQKQFSLSDKYP